LPVVRGRQEHHAVDDDRCRLHRLHDLGLDHERRPQVLDVAGIDLVAAVIAQLGVITVGVQPVVVLPPGIVQLRLADRNGLRHAGPSRALLLHFLRGSACHRCCDPDYKRSDEKRVAPHSLLHSVLFRRADPTPKLDDTERSHHWMLAATYAAVYRYPTARALPPARRAGR
jgi:hypothetical protein